LTTPDEDRVSAIDSRRAAAANPLRSIARGSVWTIATRWCIRGIGLINTIVLARLLSPRDFGIVAMAVVVWGLLQVLSDAGQTLAIIRHPDPAREHFDTAWTMSVITGIVVAVVLVAVAPLASQYFHEPRLLWVVRFIALAPLIEGFSNVGAVAGFRRSLQFHKDFSVSVISKFSTVVIALLLALVWRSYWVLAIGIVCGRTATVIASYCMASYRPRFHLTKWRELWSYSIWIQIAAIGQFVSEQTDQVIVGRVVGAFEMGAYNVAADLAAAPTEELVIPMARATFPVYATLVQEPAKLAQSYLSVLSLTAIIGLSAGFGVALVARDMVTIVLGAKWLATVPLIPWLAVSGGLLGVARSVNAILTVTGNARLNAMRFWAFALLLVPAAIAGGFGWGAEGVAAARTIVTALFVPVMFYSLTRAIPVSWQDIVSRLWRPVLSVTAMIVAISALRLEMPSPTILHLLSTILLGAGVFTITLLISWFCAGRPPGAERSALERLRSAARVLRNRIRRLRASQEAVIGDDL
jgi:O-antigen/teichoic acid export membrane protein